MQALTDAPVYVVDDDASVREREVRHRVVDGLLNRLTADRLDISIRAVEVHRARVFDKMEVKSAVELANVSRLVEQ